MHKLNLRQACHQYLHPVDLLESLRVEISLTIQKFYISFG